MMRLFSRSTLAEFVSGAVRHARRSWKSPSRRTQYRGSAIVQLLEQRTLLTNFQWDVFLDQVGGVQAQGWSVEIYDLVRTTREVVFEGYVPPVNGVFNYQAAVISDLTTEELVSDAFIVSANIPLELENTIHRSYTNRGILPW